jgi:hypothetical protein
LGQRRHEGRGIDLVIVFDEDAAPHPRGQVRLDLAASPCSEAFDLEVQALLKGIEIVQGRVVVCVPGHRQRPALRVAAVHARRLLELRHEPRVALRRDEVELKERLLPVVGLGDGRQHPGRHLRRSAGVAGIHDDHRQARLGGPPRHAQADDATAGDDHVR